MSHKLNPCDFCHQSVTMKEYMREQLAHLEKHRWYLGEERQRPIGDEELISDWITSGNAKEFHDNYIIQEELNANNKP